MTGVERVRGWVSAHPMLTPMACIAIALVRRSGGWDPPSLWLDDQWMAIALRSVSLARIWELHPPSPMGFTVLAKLPLGWSADLEWPLQVVPFTAGLLAIPAFYWLVRQLVNSRLIAALACLLAACHPTAELYALRIKHYSLELLVVTALLAVFVTQLKRPSTGGFAGLCALALLVVPFSFASLFASLALIHALLLDHIARSRAERSSLLPRLAAVALFDLAVLLLHRMFAGQTNPEIKSFWHKHFLHFDDVRSVLTFLWRGVLGYPLNIVSPWFLVLLWPLFIGLRAASRERDLRPLAWAAGLLSLGLLAAAALQIYPLGDARTGLFSYPLFWLIAAMGGERLLASQRSSWQRRGLPLLAAYLVLASLLRPLPVYSDVRDRQCVERLLQLRRPDDGLLMHQFGLLALAYYGGRPLRIVPSNAVSHNFEAWPDWPNLFVLPQVVGGVSLRERPSGARELLQSFYARRHPRVLFLSTHATAQVDDYVIAQAQAAGYRCTARYDESPRAQLFVLQRTAAGDGPARTPRDSTAGLCSKSLDSAPVFREDAADARVTRER